MNSLTLFASFLLLLLLTCVGTHAQDCPVYVADSRDIIAMDAEQRGGGGGWEYANALPGYGGSGYLVYKPDSSFGGAERKPANMGEERIKSYFFKVRTPGTYRVALTSAAPHGTEHNDVWMALPESGAYKRRHGAATALSEPLAGGDWAAWTPPEAWFKVYQNAGGLKWHSGGKTVDFEGHDVVTRELRADGTWYSVRMCGRSTQFNVDRIVVFRCEGAECDNGSRRFNEATMWFGPMQSACEGAVVNQTV